MTDDDIGPCTPTAHRNHCASFHNAFNAAASDKPFLLLASEAFAPLTNKSRMLPGKKLGDVQWEIENFFPVATNC